MGGSVGSGNPAWLPVAYPSHPPRELSQTVPMGGRWGSAPCLYRLPRNVVGQALGAPESGAVGTRPGGGKAALSRWHLPWWWMVSMPVGARCKELGVVGFSPGEGVQPRLGAQSRVGAHAGSGFSPGQGSFIHLPPTGTQPLLARPVHSFTGPQTPLLSEGHHY